MSDNEVHSRIGASSMKRWKNCPGSVRETAGMKSESSEYAKEGTRAHEVAAQCFLEAIPVDALADTPDMCEAVECYLDHLDELVHKEGGGTILVEHKFHLKELHPDLFGTADFALFGNNTGTLYVRDYKHGQGVPVEIIEDGEPNLQLMYYAVGALLTNPEKKPARVSIGIVQPRCPHQDGPIRTYEFDVIDLLDFINTLVDAVAETEKPDAPLVPGDWCRWCPAAGRPCKALSDHCNEVAAREFRIDCSYDPELLADTLKQRDTLKAFVKAVDEFAYREAVAGRFVGYGYKLVEKVGRRKFRDKDEAAEFLQLLGHDPDVLYDEPELKSPAQMEKAIGKQNAADLAPLIITETTGLALVLDSDRRPAARQDAMTAFADFVDD